MKASLGIDVHAGCPETGTMDFTPKVDLSQEEIDRGLKLVVRDGIASEMMVTLTGGAFLVSLATAGGGCGSDEPESQDPAFVQPDTLPTPLRPADATSPAAPVCAFPLAGAVVE